MSCKLGLRFVIVLFVLSLFLSLTVTPGYAEVKIKFWHAMSASASIFSKAWQRLLTKRIPE